MNETGISFIDVTMTVASGVLSGAIIYLFIVLILMNIPRPKWVCTRLGLHTTPPYREFDGSNWIGTCPQCGKKGTVNKMKWGILEKNYD